MNVTPHGRPAPDSGPLTVVLDTESGPLFFEIRAASVLREDLPQGEAAEVAAEDAASIWGLPDFVFRVGVARAGTASREVGDRLLIAGETAAVLQVKSRNAYTSHPDIERRWLNKHAAKAIRQGDGTIRRLRSGPLSGKNARNREIEIDASAYDWISTVILDHPDPPADLTISLEAARNPAVVLSRRDWEFLFRQLKSTSAVLGYLKRVAGEEHELGAEASRYFDLALADAAAEPELDPRLDLGGVHHSGPLLPVQEVAAGDDFREYLLVRSILEDVAVFGEVDEQMRLVMLGQLDRMTPADRAMVGQYLTEGLSIFRSASGETTAWRLRRIVGRFAGKMYSQLAFCTTSGSGEADRGMFGFWLQLRHHQLFELLGRPGELTSVGVQLAPRPDGKRLFDTNVFMVKGNLGFDEEQLAMLETAFPVDLGA